MISKKLILTTISLLLVGSSFLYGQTTEAAIKPSVVTGEVTGISAGKIVLNTKDGPVDVILSEKTAYKRVPPENPSLTAAVASTLGDIGEGDKLMVTGILSADKRSIPARSVYLMTKSDIAQRNAKETEEWRERGITGRVVSIDPVAKKIDVEMRTLTGSSNITLTPKENAKFLRYAPNSVKFSEAKASSFIDVQKGDMLRALGDKSTDGAAFAAEEVVTGAFQTVAGTVKSIDAEKNEVVISNLATKKDMTVAISSSSVLKRFPEEMATRLAAFQNRGGVRPIGQGAAGQQQQTGTGGGQPAGEGRPGMGGGRGGNIDEMIDRFPSITAVDLKVGDMIAVSSTRNGDVERITAIKLLAGVEPFLRAAEASRGKQGGQSGGMGDFNIPGLDSFGTP